MSYFLSESDIQHLCHSYAQAHLSFDEPIPSFDTRFRDRLESALASPQRSQYTTLAQQAATLFYEMVKQHPFLNGNKRIACVTLLVFLALNNKWLETGWKELYDIAITVASSKTENRDGIIRLLGEFVKNSLVKK